MRPKHLGYGHLEKGKSIFTPVVGALKYYAIQLLYMYIHGAACDGMSPPTVPVDVELEEVL